MRLMLLAVLLSVLPSAAQAAEECVCPKQTLAQLVDGSTLIFMGTTLYQSPQTPPGGATYSHIMKVKGVELKSPIIANNRPGGPAACAVTFMLNEGKIILARGNFDSGYYTDKCMLEQLNSKPELLNEILLMLARRAVKRESLPEAMRLDDLLAIRNEAAFHFGMHNSELAARLFERSGVISRGSPVDRLGYGEAALHIEKYGEALHAFDDVLEKNPENKQAWSGRYKALVLMKRANELPSTGVDLTNLEWRYEKLTVDMKNAILHKNWWLQIDAQGRNISGADFTEAQLVAVDFRNADLSGVNFSKAALTQVDFTGAKLDGAIFDGAVFDEVKWPQGFTPTAAPKP